MLYPELTAGVSGAACAHCLRAEDVDLCEFAGCQFFRPGPVLSPLCFAEFHQSLSFISLGDSYCNTIDIIYNNYGSDDKQ